MGPLAAASGCAERAAAWLERQAAREAQSPAGADYARRCHFLRNQLGSLQAALDVAALSAPGSELAEEAHAIAMRQSARVAAVLAELEEAAWPTR